MSNPLHTKYRPKTFKEIVGQDAVVESLQKVLSRQTSHAFIFTGPAGTGKTTLARIVARKVGCVGHNLVEVDAATNTGIDAMRAITETLAYVGLGASSTRVVIVDEAHALSKSAWQSVLKSVEEPPEHVYWMFCTTEPGKIPNTISTRCATYDLKPVHPDKVFDILKGISTAEGLEMPEKVLDLLARRCEGSVRRAITWMATCTDCRTPAAAAEVIRTASAEDGEVIDLCRALIKGGLTWPKAMALVQPLSDQNPESLRNVIVAYFNSVLLKSTKDDVTGLLNILEAFGQPYPSTGGIAPLLLSLGRVIYA